MSDIPKIIISPFSKSRDQAACTVPLENKLPEILANFHLAKPGYRDGVVLVPIAPTHFQGQIRTLQPGDTFEGEFKPRKDNEDPRKEIRVHGEPDPLVAVDVVLYSRDVLAEGNENSDPSADFEVITFLTKVSEEDQPMPPGTLMANHFLDSGGSATNMSAEEFVAALQRSHNFWKTRAIVVPPAKFTHRYLGEVMVTDQCRAMQRNNPDPTSTFVFHDDEIKEVTTTLLTPR